MTWHAARVVFAALVLALLFAFPAGAQLPGRGGTPTPDASEEWIALGILGAAAAAAIANSDNDDCYYRRGRRYCR